MKGTVVDRLYTEFKELTAYLDRGGEISLRATADENFRKALLLAAASYFEHEITQHILDFTHEASNANTLIIEFVKNKAISRQYHTFFNWDGANANSFFSLFGEKHRAHMQQELKNRVDLDSAVKAFLEIGRERNRLVHQDFGTFSMEKTADEIYDLYLRALPFVESIPANLRQSVQSSSDRLSETVLADTEPEMAKTTVIRT